MLKQWQAVKKPVTHRGHSQSVHDHATPLEISGMQYKSNQDIENAACL